VAVDKDELTELMLFAVDLARGAGDITLNYFQKRPETSKKADGSFVTIADREAEKYLRKRILDRYPGDSVLGEEEGESKGNSNRRWIVDPIDGTFAFVHGVPIYGVLIGLEIDGKPTVGVINMPALNEIAWAATGLGCYLNGAPARVSTTASLEDGLLLCSDFTACHRYGFGSAIEELQRRAKSNRTWGDCYGYVLVATGRAEVILDPVMNIWDCAALLPIMEEAGGTFTDLQGGEVGLGTTSVLATNGKLHTTVAEALKI